MKAAIYTRFSSQAQNPLSCADQEAVCRDWCASNGYEVAAVYADEAVSGRSDRRPAFQAMIADAEGSGWDAVVVYKLDRFARNRADAALYRQRLAPVRVVSAMEAIPVDASGIILEGVLETVNEYYSANLSELTRRGMRAGAERCEALGVNVYGYEIVDNHYHLNDAEAAVVREVYQMALGGASVGAMLDRLRSAGALTSTGRPPSYSFLHQLLRNPKYAGVYVWGDVVVEDGMPAIVDRATWDKVQALSLRRRPARDGRRADYWLYGRVFCSEGHAMIGESAKGGAYFYYRCPVCGLRIRKEKLEGMVGAMARDAMAPEMAEDVVDAMVAFDEGSGKAERRAELRRLVAATEKAVGRLLDALEAGVDPSAVGGRIDEARAAIRGYEAELEDLERERPSRDALLAGYHLLRAEGDDRQIAEAFLRLAVVTSDLVAAAFNYEGAPVSVEEVMADIEKHEPGGSPVRAVEPWLPIVQPARIVLVGPWKKPA